MLPNISMLLIFLTLPLLVKGIIGGAPVEKHEYPWIVHVSSTWNDLSERSLCGGSIISKNLIMTAAHCVRDKTDLYIGFSSFVIAGNSDMTTNGTSKVFVRSILIHPEFNDTRRLSNDIALLRLQSDLVFDEKIQPIALPSKNYTEDELMDNKVTRKT